MNPTHPTAPASMAMLRLAEANKSAPFAAYPGWQLDLRATLDSHAQLVESLQAIVNQADAQFRAGDRHATFNRQTIDAIRAALAAAKE